MKNASLAEQLESLLTFRNRPDIDAPIEGARTNWSTSPAKDNSDTADYGFERKLLITPSVQEIMRNVKEGDVEYGFAIDDHGKRHRVIVRMGALRFSDGKQTEKACATGTDGKLIRRDLLMPTGAMLGTREKADMQLGGRGASTAYIEQSNLYFAQMLGAIEPRYVKRGKRRNGRSYSADEARTMLADAYANTPTLPAVKRYHKGLPCGGQRIADSFLGMQKGKKGESGSIAWEDVSTHIVNREVWEATVAMLTEADTAVLDKALVAGSLAELGDSGHRRTRERQGRRKLQAANDNLTAALRAAA